MAFTANLQYRSCPLFFEGAMAPTWLQGQWNVIDATHGSITMPDGEYLSVQPNGSYQGRGAVGPWETFTVDADLNLLSVTTGTGVHLKIPYCGL